MSRDKEYLKYKPFADDLREAESWCELDGVLNRYQTVKNLHKMGYRKIHDDHQRQCTCYALGCQMAEELKREVAREIFEELEKIAMHNVTLSYGLWLMSMGEVAFAKIKEKYTEGEE